MLIKIKFVSFIHSTYFFVAKLQENNYLYSAEDNQYVREIID